MNTVPSGTPEPNDKRAPVAGGGGPPYDGGMDRRLTVLETRFDTILPTLATKADLAALRAELGDRFMGLHNDLCREMEKIRIEMANMRTDMEKLRTELRAEMHAFFSSVTKWFISLAVTMILSLFGFGVHLHIQISNLSARLPVAAPASAPAASAPALPDAVAPRR